MKDMFSIPRRLLALTLTSTLPFGALAEPPGMFPPPPQMTGAPGPHGGMPPHDMAYGSPLPPVLHGIKLSDEQQDKVFAILHDAAPAFRDLAKAQRRAEEELQQFVLSERFDEAGLRARAEALARQWSGLATLRGRTDRQILALLTPEQRRQLTERTAKDKTGR